jgi:hypothetical protein
MRLFSILSLGGSIMSRGNKVSASPDLQAKFNAAMNALIAFGEGAGCSCTASGELSDYELEAVAGGVGSGSGSHSGTSKGSSKSSGVGAGIGTGFGSGSGSGRGPSSFSHSRS